MATTTQRHTATLTVISTPTEAQLHCWWRALQADPMRSLVYTDFMPTAFTELQAAMSRGEIIVWMFLVGDDEAQEVGGAFYLHDLGVDDDGPYAWLGTYVLRAYRGLTLRAWALVRTAWAHQGLCRLFVAARQSNRPVRQLLPQAGFTRLGLYIDWSYFGGVLDTAVVYTLRPADQGRAWVAAEARSPRFRRLGPTCTHKPWRPGVEVWSDGGLVDDTACPSVH